MKTLKSNFILSIGGMGMLIGSLAGTLGYTTIPVAVGLSLCIGGIFGAIRILDEKITMSAPSPAREK